MEKNQKQAYILAIVAIISWSTAATAFKIALSELTFIQIILQAIIVSICFFACIIIWQKKTYLFKHLNKKDILKSATLGFINPFAYYYVLLQAYSLLPAQLALSINYIWPIVLVLLSVPLLGHKLKIMSIISILISFVGVLIIANKGSITHINISSYTGVCLAFTSTILWALYWIFNVRDKRDDSIKLFLNFIFGLIYILIFALTFYKLEIPSPKAIIASSYIGIFECGLPFILWLKAMQKTSATDKIGNLVYICPFLSFIFIYFVLGESIYISTLSGLVLIITGIILQQVSNKKQNIETR